MSPAKEILKTYEIAVKFGIISNLSYGVHDDRRVLLSPITTNHVLQAAGEVEAA